jgi:hypothetical protein
MPMMRLVTRGRIAGIARRGRAMIPLRTRLFRPLRLVTLALVIASVAGCGYTAHDEYYASRRDSFAASPGDGTIIAVSPVESVLSSRTVTASAWRVDGRE